MPYVVLHIIKRDLKAKRAVAKAVTNAVVKALKVPPEAVHIVINEMTKEQYATAGVLYCDGEKKKGRSVKRVK
jgi:4-oxalocrotonate tautomerase